MRWPEDASGWPMAEHSEIIACAPHQWHVQSLGNGPTLLLLHGAGGATQSWRNLAPTLGENFNVVCVDLPGQGFTRSGAQNRFGLDAMAQDVSKFCAQEQLRPTAIIGHSAGAAVALRMVQLGFETDIVIGVNAALKEFGGMAGWLFPVTAKILAALPFAATAFSANATRASVAKLLAGTGSKIDSEGQRNYLTLIKDTGHVGATLSMMAQWDLKPLLRELAKIECEVLLLAGENDKTVLPSTSIEAAKRMKHARAEILPGLGHLAHEEAPLSVAEQIQAAIKKTPG